MDKTVLQIPLNFKEKLVEEIAFLQQFARRFASDNQDMDDLVQDTMMKAMLCFDKFKSGTNLKGWLYVLMRNIYLNSYKRQSRYKKFRQVADDGQLFYMAINTDENGGMEKFIRDDIKHALSKLESIESAPLKLYISGFKYREIAYKLQVPIGTVKTRIFTARTKLKKDLRDYQQVQ